MKHNKLPSCELIRILSTVFVPELNFPFHVIILSISVFNNDALTKLITPDKDLLCRFENSSVKFLILREKIHGLHCERVFSPIRSTRPKESVCQLNSVTSLQNFQTMPTSTKEKLGSLKEKLSHSDLQIEILDNEIARTKKALEEVEYDLNTKTADNKDKLADQYQERLKEKVKESEKRYQKQEVETTELLEQVENLEEEGGLDQEPTTPFLKRLLEEKDEEIITIKQKIETAEKELLDLKKQEQGEREQGSPLTDSTDVLKGHEQKMT
ncbi:hypothetical protein BDF20DRAFT_836343 [Mycotypha africana]|uniref:uncharacterized protein n=1 Tax=Mycotypha africana TaxID=64632 RepID=UPI002301F46D|nr:uncharacterized protein BDF20DRAFT_836343 [Mycotypha africana]KAI8977556.1 hypothetical protein BDF20DRAFT_836343 [Mycotypha africana]